MSTPSRAISVPGEQACRPAAREAVLSDGNALSAFVEARPRLFTIACRILGSAAAAEDVVQDAWLRWQASDRSLVQNAPAYFATTTMRLAINVIHSARSRRETNVGTWLAEPADTRPDPHSELQRREALEHAVLLLLQTLSPRESAAYVLREAFSCPYRRIAGILRIAEANARQLVVRARKRVAGRPRPPACSAERQRLLDGFIAATRQGKVAALEELIASAIADRCS
jgi:RNA polymerase sigma-70 factor (ECF subfamily)